MLMTSYTKIFNDLFQALPAFLGWMDQLLESHRENVVPITEFNFKKIKIVFSPVLLKRTNVVLVDGDIPLPLFEKIGIQQFSGLNVSNAIGVTYKNNMFLKEEHCTEINCFHEMIHIVQWNQLGVERFLLAYGIGLALYGYEDNPFEQTAYIFQKKLEDNVLPMNFLKQIEQQTNDTWSSLNPLNHLQNWQ